MIGVSVDRVEDRQLLAAETQFIASIEEPGQLYLHVIRSKSPFGLIKQIDCSIARNRPGVIAVLAGGDLSTLPPIGFRGRTDPALLAYRQPVLAQKYVRYVGEPVAVVVAETLRDAVDAADYCFIELDDRPPVASASVPPQPFDPLAKGSPTTQAAQIGMGYGDVTSAFNEAPHRIEIACSVGRQTGMPMETRGLLAVPSASDILLDVYGVAKLAHTNRDALALMLDIPSDRIVMHEGHVGGGFGVRGELYPEDVLVCLAAIRLGRPVKWIETRDEHLVATNQSRDQSLALRAAVDSRGFILGLDAEILVDQGAYLRTHEIKVADLTCAFLPGPYKIPSYRVNAFVRLTNKTPCGTYRAPGRFEATFAMERLLDAISNELQIDPVQVRRVNLIDAASMPFDRGLTSNGRPVIYDSGDYRALLERAIRETDYYTLRAEAVRRRSAGEWIGLGLAFFVEKSGVAHEETVRMSVNELGEIEIHTGASSMGQGMETALIQIAAEATGLGMDCFRMVRGSTKTVAKSNGTFGSRVTVVVGSAVYNAGIAFKQAILACAARLLRTEVDTLSIDAAGMVTYGTHRVRMVDVIAASARDGDGINATADATVSGLSYPFGVHLATVRVDPATFAVKVEQYVIVYDIGRAINPGMVKAQLIGGAMQGIGGALSELIRYDGDCRPLTTSYADYGLPTASDTPAFRVILLEDAPSPTNILGLKGAGEGGINAAGAAIASAVENAFANRVVPMSLPITPASLFKLHRAAFIVSN